MTPKFCKQYAQVGSLISGALAAYRDDVRGGAFPGQQFSPYRMRAAEVDAFAEALAQAGMQRAAEAAASSGGA